MTDMNQEQLDAIRQLNEMTGLKDIAKRLEKIELLLEAIWTRDQEFVGKTKGSSHE